MYSILHETDDATTVNYSAFGKFLPCDSKQLVTIGSKCMKFYRLNPYVFVEEKGLSVGGRQTTNLECIFHFTLMAPPRSMKTARIPIYPESDSIIMTFEDAKLSIVGINPATMNLRTLSLHCIEDDFLRDGYFSDTQYPELSVDPDCRCCAFLVFGRHLAIVPFIERNKNQLLESYTVPLRNFEDRLDNISDMTFLNGYYEPTILFLYQPIQTTAGRASIRYDTVSILGVSLNVKDRSHAVVWNFGGLPMTIDRCLSMPLPVSGICLIGINEIVYLNQSVPPCGISLNSCADEFTKFPLINCQEQKITLDCSVFQAFSKSEVFVVSKTGSLFLLRLDIDTFSNAVRSLSLMKIFETVIPYTLTLCFSGYLFVGSRLGDSELLQYSFKSKFSSGQNELEDTKNKKSRMENSSDDLNEDDEFLYGSEEVKAKNVTVVEQAVQIDREFNFKLLDKLNNIAPCKDVKCCKASNISDELKKTYFENKDAYFDFVVASGHEKESALCFLERTIRPDIFTSSILQDAKEFWTVGRRKDNTHRYLIVSKPSSTLVLELSGDDMSEIDDDIFLMTETTIAAGDLDDGNISVQITSQNIVLVADGQQLAFVSVDSNFPVQMASIIDQFFVLLTQNGKILLYRLMLKPHIHLMQVSPLEKLKHEKSPITAVSLYRDVSGLIGLSSSQEDLLNLDVYDHYGRLKKSKTVENAKLGTKNRQIDDIDAILYGEGEGNNKNCTVASKRQLDTVLEHENIELFDNEFVTDVFDPSHVIPTYWIFFTRENGNLYIYSVPEFQMVYMVKKFNQLHEVIYDDAETAFEEERYMNIPTIAIAPKSSDNKTSSSVLVRPEELVVEICVYGMGVNQARPVLFAVIDDMVVFYEMFYFENGIKDHLSIRFHKLNKNVVIRSGRFIGVNGRASVETGLENERHGQYIKFFDKIGKLNNGVFITGNYPSIFFIGKKGTNLHPFIIDGPLNSFSSFNNTNCPYGFLYLTRDNFQMRISMLHDDVNYDASFPFRKISVGRTVHFVVYILHSNVFAVVTSEKKSSNRLYMLINEDRQIETYERDENFILPMPESYSLTLFSTEDWSFVPTVEEKFEEFEIVTCCEEVVLHSEASTSGLQSYLAVGTSVNCGEEVFVRGRVIIYEPIEVVAAEGLSTTRHSLKTLYNKEQKGPVTSMCSCNGYLLTGMGQKVFIWQFRDNHLHGVSFLDLHFYIHKLVGFRNLALACDLHRSLSLIRYQEEFKALSLVSRDLRLGVSQPMTAQFVVDNRQLGFLLTDESGNLILFSYFPEAKESNGGERLIIRSGLNIGSLVNSLVRVKGHGAGENSQETQNTIGSVQNCVFLTLDGCIGVVRPLTEKIFRRLHMLQQVMSVQVSQAAGLNPRGSRTIRPQRTGVNQQLSSAKNIVDGLLLFQYIHLSTQEKTDLARRLGSNRYQIIDDLTELKRIMTHF